MITIKILLFLEMFHYEYYTLKNLNKNILKLSCLEENSYNTVYFSFNIKNSLMFYLNNNRTSTIYYVTY